MSTKKAKQNKTDIADVRGVVRSLPSIQEINAFAKKYCDDNGGTRLAEAESDGIIIGAAWVIAYSLFRTGQ